MSFLYHEEFLWFDPQSAALDPSGQNTHVALGTGTVFMRSGWPSGPADTDPSATYLTFQSGDHFSYHQHFDQNSFTLFKYGDLAVDSGVYSGDGLSYHDQNYYVRTIAHNTLVVHNPAEDFSTARPDAVSNDGGQRTMSPGSRAPRPRTAGISTPPNTTRATSCALSTAATTPTSWATPPKPTTTRTIIRPWTRPSAPTCPRSAASSGNWSICAPSHQNIGEYVVLFDRVGVTQPSFSGANTKLLIHTLNQPTVSGTGTTISPGETLFTGADRATATSGEGRLTVDVLLPDRRQSAGGRAAGRRSRSGSSAKTTTGIGRQTRTSPGPSTTSKRSPTASGGWRSSRGTRPSITTSSRSCSPPMSARRPCPRPRPSRPRAAWPGVHIADAGQNRVVLFSTAQDGAAPDGAVTYSYTPTTDPQPQPALRHAAVPALRGRPLPCEMVCARSPCSPTMRLLCRPTARACCAFTPEAHSIPIHLYLSAHSYAGLSARCRDAHPHADGYPHPNRHTHRHHRPHPHRRQPAPRRHADGHAHVQPRHAHAHADHPHAPIPRATSSIL